MIRFVLFLLLFLFIYRIVVRFILPLLHITNTTSNRIKEMQRNMEEMQQRMNTKQQNGKNVKEGEYIEYEEVR